MSESSDCDTVTVTVTHVDLCAVTLAAAHSATVHPCLPNAHALPQSRVSGIPAAAHGADHRVF